MFCGCVLRGQPAFLNLTAVYFDALNVADEFRLERQSKMANEFKSRVFAAYSANGKKPAMALAEELGLLKHTVRSWFSVWGRDGFPPGGPEVKAEPKAKKPVKAKVLRRARIVKKSDADTKKKKTVFTRDSQTKCEPYFKYGSREMAERAILLLTKDLGMRKEALHVIEENGRFAIAPAHHKRKDGPIPTFKTGTTVFDITIPNSRATVIKAGPEVSEVRYDADGPYGKQERNISNIYLTELEEFKTPRSRIAK